MSNVRVKLNYSGVRELLKSTPVKSMLNEYGQRVMDNLPAGYEIETVETDRAVVKIHAATPKARIENSKNNTLLNALGSAKG